MTRLTVTQLVLIVMFALISAPSLAAQQQKNEAEWSSLRFLLGEWGGEGGGQPGQSSSGAFAFSFDLQGKVLVRRSYAEYPSSKDKPAYRHDDLTIMYRDGDGKEIRATFFDNEGHVIQYRVMQSEDQRTLTLVSDAVASAPRYRFMYRYVNENTLSFEFDIAPQGKPDAFSKYVDGTARRKPSKKSQ